MNLKQILQNHKNKLMLLGSIALCASVGIISVFIGGVAVNDVSIIWYEILFKPSLTPPAWLFQGIWMFLSLLMGVALYLALNSENINQTAFLDKLKKYRVNIEPYSGKTNKKLALTVFGIYLFLSILLIPVFFGLKSTLGGLLVSILMCAAILLLFYKFCKITIAAGLLVIPAVLWSSYLVGLNFAFCLIN